MDLLTVFLTIPYILVEADLYIINRSKISSDYMIRLQG
jgi:hypothetical protein